MGRFVIRPDLRRQGIGKKLVRLAFETLMDQGVEEFFMEGRDATVDLVCSFGGEKTGEPFKFFNGNCTPLYLHRDKYIPEK
jgi:predicted GNAT family N-acyltransferase